MLGTNLTAGASTTVPWYCTCTGRGPLLRKREWNNVHAANKADAGDKRLSETLASGVVPVAQKIFQFDHIGDTHSCCLRFVLRVARCWVPVHVVMGCAR